MVLGFYGVGAAVIMFIVPLVTLFTRAEGGKPRFTPETRRLLLWIYVGVLITVAAVIGLAKIVLMRSPLG
jgi:hypothetical protein